MKTMYNGKMVETVDCTPTWESVIDIYIACLENPKAGESGKQSARGEIKKMARLADERNALQKKLFAIVSPGIVNETPNRTVRKQLKPKK